MNTIPLINNAPSTNFSMNKLNAVDKSGVRSTPVNDAQLRQEVNTSIVALKREAFSLETLIAQAAQTLQDVNKRLSELEGKQGDYVKKTDATVASVGGDGKYISAISETDGVISATATDLGNMVPVNSVTSGNMHSVTSGAVYSELFKLLIGENNNPDNFPVDAMRAYKVRNYNIGWVSNDGIILTIPWSENYVFQIAVDDQSNFMAVRSKSGSSWNDWQQIPLGFGIKNIWTEEKTKYGNASGANIIWTCIEFQNGLKACFGNTTSVRTSDPTGNVYYSGGTDDSWYFPTNLFTSKPTCFMNISGESVWMWAGIQDKGSKDVTPLVCPHSSIAFTNQTIRFNILAFGV